MENLSEEICEFMKVLGFDNVRHIPKLKEVKKSYYDRSKEIHPDKHMNENESVKKSFEEQFKKLHTAYTTISRFIIENATNEDDDEEESWARKEFESANVMTMNTKSVTLSIPREHTNAWVDILCENFGRPVDQTSSYNGLQFKTKNGTSIKIWTKKRTKRNTMFVDGSAYFDFIKHDLPKLFREVLKRSKESSSNNTSPVISNPSKRIIKCDL